MWLIKFFIFTILIIAISSKDYKGYKVYDIISQTDQQKNLLHDLHKTGDYDFWSLAKVFNQTAKVMVAPNQQNKFEDILKTNKFVFNIMHGDVSNLIKDELENMQYISPRNKNSRAFDFEHFHSFDDINKHLDQLVEKFPDRVSVILTSKSYQKREIKVLSITNGDGRKDKKVIFIDGGIHAREWIAPAGALYVIDQLVNNFENHKNLLEDYDWIILPVVNPDGYEYTRTSNRLWRKTRKPYGDCMGADGNRNFNYHWAETGTEIKPCSEIYHGTKPFSEPETVILRDLLHSFDGRCKMYLTLHSFGKYLLYPWGWTSDLPDTVADLNEVAQAAAAAIKDKTGEIYTVGTSTNVLYPAAGGSDDYAFGKANIPIAITIEMNGKGFIIEPDLILNYVEECWVGIKAMAEVVIKKYK